MRYARLVLLAGALAAVALGMPRGAQGVTWSFAAIDSAADAGPYSSLEVDGSGDILISYYDVGNEDLKFAVCEQSASAHGNCAEPGEWSAVTVDAPGKVGFYGSLAVDGSGDPMISYRDMTNLDLKFALCDRSASAGGQCDQPADWIAVAVDTAGSVGEHTSIAAGANGDPMIAYYDRTNRDLKFAICDRSASTNGNCDQAGDWSVVAADSAGDVGFHTAMAVDAGGNPLIAYWDVSDAGLKFATCDRLASTNGNCDQPSDWETVTVDTQDSLGWYPSIAMTPAGDPVISYYDDTNEDLKFAVCEASASNNGNCDQTADWTSTMVDSAGDVGWYTSITADGNGDPLIAYYDATSQDLKFAYCDASASAGGDCGQTADWESETVDSAGIVGRLTSIGIDVNGNPVISYADDTNLDLKFATGSATDVDGDGVPDVLDNCPAFANPTQADGDGDGAGDVCDNCPWAANADQANGDGDEWGDACDGCPSVPTVWVTPPGDTDCDGFTDAEETFAGTDAADACPDGSTDDAWPADMAAPGGFGEHDGGVNILDVVQLTPPAFNASPPDPDYSVRKDLNADGAINILDVVRLTPPMFGASCTP